MYNLFDMSKETFREKENERRKEMIRKRSMGMYILLTLITCGIYGIYFWYCYTVDINRVCEGDGEESPNYIIVLLLSIITCGIYGIYWYYKQANRLKRAGSKYGVAIVEGGSEFLLWYILGMFLCFIGSLIGLNILIKNMNLLVDSYNGRYVERTMNNNTGYGKGTAFNTGAADMGVGNADTQKRAAQPKFCQKCGASLEGKAYRFCPKCGNPVE